MPCLTMDASKLRDGMQLVLQRVFGLAARLCDTIHPQTILPLKLLDCPEEIAVGEGSDLSGDLGIEALLTKRMLEGPYVI